MNRLIMLDDKLVPYEKATIHVSSGAMKYAASVFEGIRGYVSDDKNTINLLAVRQHVKRLFDSIKLMRMEVSFDENMVIERICKVITANRYREDCYIRCAVSISAQGAEIDAIGPSLLTIDAFAQGRKSTQKTGVNICISSWSRITDNSMPPRIKCIANYQNGRLAMLQAKAEGYNNVLLLNQFGKICEAPTACVFLVKDKQLITPPITAGILESITRKLILKIANNNQLSSIEREIDRSEIYLADEAFLCGTGCEVIPIITVDKYSIGKRAPGEITQFITRIYNSISRMQDESYNSYMYALPL